MRVLLTTFLFLVVQVYLQAQVVRGVITDHEGKPIPGANIIIKNSSRGVSSDSNGRYQIRISSGQTSIVFRMMGYETEEKEVSLKAGVILKLDVSLKEYSTQLGEVEVLSDTRDFARDIMREARDKRKGHLDALKQYKCDTYRRISFLTIEPKYVRDSVEKATNDSLMSSLNPKDKEKELRKQKREIRKHKRELRKHKRQIKRGRRKSDKLLAEGDTLIVQMDTAMVRYISGMSEALSTLYYQAPYRYKEITDAQNDYRVKWPYQFYYVGLGNESEGVVVDNITSGYFNYSLMPDDPAEFDYNFYKSNLSLPDVCEKPLLSPLAPASGLSYQFDYEGVTYEGTTALYRIAVNPIFPDDALFRGYLIIEDQTWALRYVDLSINPAALLYDKEYRICERYKSIGNGISVPDSCSVIVTSKEGKRTTTSTMNMLYSDWSILDNIPAKTFGNEVKRYAPDAFTRDSLWWAGHRPFPLNEKELRYAKRIDSLSVYYNSEKFLFRLDSSYNHLDLWSFVYKGIMYRSREKKYQMSFSPLVEQINPFGIGGYRHNLNGTFLKRFNNEFLFETNARVDYGFGNNDIRGKGGFGLTYVPKKFVRTFVRFGDYYDMINERSSISTIISRSNYARTQMFSVAQRMEIVNGLFGELTFTYSDQKPLTGMHIESWSNHLFGENNAPLDFERYIKSELQLEFTYRIKQKYVFKGNRKILLGSKWPDLTFKWRHGIHGLFNSEVNFDYLEFGVKGTQKLLRWGTSNWSFLGGSFVNTKSLRLLEHKYFRGSDPIFFSNPLTSFQLLGPTLNCSSTFIRGTYIHHFEGSIMNKIPVLSKLRISPAAGAGFIMMQENSFRHIEMFAGLERIIRIRKELFRVGVFAVTADNNLSKATFTWKIGISTSNVFSKKWDY